MTNDETDAIFRKLMGQMEHSSDLSTFFESAKKIEHGPDSSALFEPIDNVKQTLMDSLVDHIQTFGDDIEATNEEELSIISDTIEECVNKDFSAIEGLDYGDEIIASGETLFLVSDNTTGEVNIRSLKDGMYLQGSLSWLGVTRIFSIEFTSLFFQVSHDNNLSETDKGNVLEEYQKSHNIHNDLGLVAIIDGAFLVSSDGSREPIPDNKTAILPMNYPKLKLGRII